MKKIYCELHMFDLHQNIYTINTDTGVKDHVAITTIEELPEVLSAISNNYHISDIVLGGNSILGTAVAEDILAYAKIHYKDNNINVEVIK